MKTKTQAKIERRRFIGKLFLASAFSSVCLISVVIFAGMNSPLPIEQVNLIVQRNAAILLAYACIALPVGVYLNG